MTIKFQSQVLFYSYIFSNISKNLKTKGIDALAHVFVKNTTIEYLGLAKNKISQPVNYFSLFFLIF